MAKDTLLDIVQDILSDADGDNVNSISDTVESDQCARIVRNEFKDIVDNMDLSHHKTVKQLTATSSTTPTRMIRPEGFYNIEWVKYDKRLLVGDDPSFSEVYWMEPENFIERSASMSVSDSEVITMLVGTYSLNILNNKAPSYYTILEGYDNLIFDSYDAALETNLQSSKSLAYGIQRPTLALSDTAIPDLPENQMQLLKNRARAMFFDLYKQGVTKEIDKRSRNSEVRAQRQRHIAAQTRRKDQRRTPDYGRK